MKRLVSYGAVFAMGLAISALAINTLYGIAPNGQSADNAASKHAVLAALETTPLPHNGQTSVIADAAAKVEPAVVTVHTTGIPIHQQMMDPFGGDPMFRQFFGGGGNGSMQGPTIQQHGAGSGVILSADGYIMTNYHVVRNTEKVAVTTADKKTYQATVVGSDPVTDIAVVKIKPDSPLPIAQLGNSDDLRIGDWAIAVGDPLDIGTTVTLGIVSALNRTGLSADGGHALNAVIQTDAAINPGNSGGALANINGQVIGINEAIYSPTGSYVGIGFAIPINSARKIAAELIENGKIVRPYLGIGMDDVSHFTPEALSQVGVHLDHNTGALVTQVYPNSPAADAGLKTYDVVLEINRQPVKDAAAVDQLISSMKVGDTVTLLISRNGSQHVLTATLKQRPMNYGEAPQDGQDDGQGNNSPDNNSPDNNGGPDNNVMPGF